VPLEESFQRPPDDEEIKRQALMVYVPPVKFTRLAMFAALSTLLGFSLGLRFKVMVLPAATVVAVFVVAAGAGSSGQSSLSGRSSKWRFSSKPDTSQGF
jgi:hypothetical protein